MTIHLFFRSCTCSALHTACPPGRGEVPCRAPRLVKFLQSQLHSLFLSSLMLDDLHASWLLRISAWWQPFARAGEVHGGPLKHHVGRLEDAGVPQDRSLCCGGLQGVLRRLKVPWDVLRCLKTSWGALRMPLYHRFYCFNSTCHALFFKKIRQSNRTVGVSICVYMYLCLCVWVSVRLCFLCLPVSVCMYVCMYVCVYVCMHGGMYVCVCMCMYVYVCVCMYVCLYVSMYVYIYTHVHVYMKICIHTLKIYDICIYELHVWDTCMCLHEFTFSGCLCVQYVYVLCACMFVRAACMHLCKYTSTNIYTCTYACTYVCTKNIRLYLF